MVQLHSLAADRRVLFKGKSVELSPKDGGWIFGWEEKKSKKKLNLTDNKDVEIGAEVFCSLSALPVKLFPSV